MKLKKNSPCRDPLSQGTTGLISWQGAMLLSAWSDSFGDSVLAGKRVLELGMDVPRFHPCANNRLRSIMVFAGSGLGLYGLSLLAREVPVRSYTFTGRYAFFEL